MVVSGNIKAGLGCWIISSTSEYTVGSLYPRVSHLRIKPTVRQNYMANNCICIDFFLAISLVMQNSSYFATYLKSINK